MSVLTGNTGTVEAGSSTVLEITKWSFTTKSELTVWASNTSNGHKKRKGGTKDGTGSIEGKYDDSQPVEDILEEGSEVTLTLVRDTGNEITVPAVIEQLEFEVDVDSGAVQSWTASFGSNGAWSYS